MADQVNTVPDSSTRNRFNGAELAGEYMASLLETNPDLNLNSADAKARGVQREQNGTITVKIANVGRMEWRAAIKGGFIGPKFGKRQCLGTPFLRT